jgi:NAD(P)-dependent dehydrogenase (short-subunit alcohol dehydrogenase family)
LYIQLTPKRVRIKNIKEFRDYVFGNILFDRLAGPEDVVEAVLYLASPASDMVTGHILHVDSGWMAR